MVAEVVEVPRVLLEEIAENLRFMREQVERFGPLLESLDPASNPVGAWRARQRARKATAKPCGCND